MEKCTCTKEQLQILQGTKTMKTKGTILYVLLAILAIVVAVYAVQYFMIANAPMQAEVGKAQANAQSQAFQSSEAYVNGKNSELSQMIYEYSISKDLSVKTALLGRIKEAASTVDINKLSVNVQEFLRTH